MIRAPEDCACPLVDTWPTLAEKCGGGAFLVFMSLLEAYINGRCSLADPCNRIRGREEPDHVYDFIIVGGGTAGSVVASRLSENAHWKVLLIEAGIDQPPVTSVPGLYNWAWGNAATDWNYKSEPQKSACKSSGGICDWPRGKMLGGTSSLNLMNNMRGNPKDYARWAAEGADMWTWDEVFPYFLKLENNKQVGPQYLSQYHSQGGPITIEQFPYHPDFAHEILNTGVEMGYQISDDLQGEVNVGFAIAQSLNNNGTRVSTATAYLRPASARPNLHVLLEAHTTRVIIDPNTLTATGVELIHNGVTKTAHASKEVILSAGTFNSPQLLLLSGIGPRHTLEAHNIPVIKDLQAVGKHFRNHVGVNLKFDLESEPAKNQLDWTAIMDYFLGQDGPLSATGLTQILAMINTQYADPAGDYPDVQLLFHGFEPFCASTADHGAPLNPEDPDAKEKIGIMAIVLQSDSEGTVTLRSDNPLDKPLVDYQYFSDPNDMDKAIDAVRIVMQFVNSKVMSKYKMTWEEEQINECLPYGPRDSVEFLKCIVETFTAPENHQVNSCVVGRDDERACVDNYLRVHGVNGLRVIDASVLTLVSGNTMVPTIMIAERGSEMIRKAYSVEY